MTPDSYEQLKAHFDRIQAADIAARVKRHADYRTALAALRSIANNSCCTPCREAGMVARLALQEMGEPLSADAVDPVGGRVTD